MPTTISRELIIKQFPFWIKGTWCYKPGIFSYANVTPVLNNYAPKNFNILYIFCIIYIYNCFIFYILII